MNEYRQLEMKEKRKTKREDYRYFVGTTLKNSLKYEIGEKMVFKIRAKYMDDYLDVPYIQYTLKSDDGQSREGYIEKSADGWFYIEASISKSGFVYVQARACDKNKAVIDNINAYNGSAGADVVNVCRVTKEPDDYLEFWDKLKAEVEQTEPKLLYCERIKDEKNPDFETYDVRIMVPRGEYASATVAYPKGAEKGSIKAAFGFQGYGVRPISPVPLKGYFYVSVNAHPIPNRESDEFYANLRDNELKGYGYGAVENERPETTYWARMMLRDLQIIRYFRDHELLNKKDYHFIGSSQGGMQACNMAARFEGASALILNVPWLCDVYGHELGGRRENRMPKGLGITYFDTSIAAQYISCPTYIISGLGDANCHPSTQMALFNSIKSQKYIEFYQNKIHSYTIPWDRNMYALGDVSLADKFREHTESYYSYD